MLSFTFIENNNHPVLNFKKKKKYDMIGLYICILATVIYMKHFFIIPRIINSAVEILLLTNSLVSSF